MKKFLKGLILITIALTLFYKEQNVFAENTIIDEIILTGELELETLEEGELPQYSLSTTTENITIESYGWAKLPRDSENWTDCETAIDDGSFYAMKLSIKAASGYEINQSTKIIYNTRDMYDTYSSITPYDGGAYVYVDFGQLRKEETPPDQIRPEKEYTITSENGDAIISFNFADFHDFVFSFINILKLSPEVIEENFDVPAEFIEQAISSIKNNTKDYGNLLGIYAIDVQEGSFSYSDSVTLKIKIKDDMKNYNSFKFIFLDENNEFKVQEVHDTDIKTIDGEKYIVVNLNHLSAYALVGNNVQENNNPATGDKIVFYIIMLGLCTFGIAGVGIYTKKKCYL